ncbi:UDP-4-dehydro-6-deoxy-2-acetamido-D-glucose 4-reductase [Fusobacterium hwasookii ChDC F174]|uniref:UDP-4-dehydro-6-deoxy-2-acetamido-D-glucose 4-reductase n=1 Tax=Fusobacterium hwasookii ChDC F174 TaxID=1307442 RepID=A0A0S2ZJZ7_9FUSO|nr:nucleoside-diphosphate sugar epimerase/dehydratase [Fusobacterium hwasookii]ALQ39176.1 UDP-4-dehydro-6-deoxy-2-acetamido-D-glucose 4-reductase [Fusobacterium hwasookii ChDC F174]
MNNIRKLIKFIIDIFLLNLSLTISIFLKYEQIIVTNKNINFFIYYNLSFCIIYFILKIYNNSWRFSGISEYTTLIILSVSTTVLSYMTRAFFKLDTKSSLYFEVFIIFTFLLILSRFLMFLTRMKGILKKDSAQENVLIYGAGESGVLLVKESSINPNFPYRIIGFLDDNPNKIGGKIYGLRVFGGLDKVKEVVEKKDISKIIISMPSVSQNKISNIIKEINKIEGLSAKILPNVDNLIEEGNLTTQLRNIKLEDLLGRDEIRINTKEVFEFIQDKVIFVTGGGGSIGSELINQIAKYNPKKIINIEINENASYLMELELKRKYPFLDYKTEIASVRDSEKLDMLFNKYRPDILFHAAAHKHVPLMENNPEEAIKNNIFGTKNVAECCLKYKLESVVLISTDKAVNPTNVMGATKRVCEMIFQKYSEKSSDTKFMAVRFGNVLGSNGSVIPIFSKLIEEGKNLTLTHKDIIRYFMTIPEAAQLVIEAATIGKGGEILILDMGEPVKIYDLAKNMIKLSGSTVGIDIVGLRPGEKLFEELLYDVNSSEKTSNNKIYITNMENEKVQVDIDNYYTILKKLIKENDVIGMRKTLADIIGTFKGRVE